MRGYLTPSSLGAVEEALEDSDPLVRRAALTVLEAVDVQARLRLEQAALLAPYDPGVQQLVAALERGVS